MKNYFSLLCIALLFISSCSSDDDNSIEDNSSTDDKVTIEVNRLTDHADDFENSMLMLSFIGDEDLDIESEMELDSTFVGDQEDGMAGKEFYYSFSELEESMTFETTTPVIEGIFYFETFKREGAGESGDLYNVKVYHGDELFTEETITELTEDPDNGKIFTSFHTTEEPDF